MEELAYATAARLAEMIRTKEVSPVEVVTATLDRIDRHNGSINAFVTVCADMALEEARAAERAVVRGDALGPLHGVPIGVKDLDPVAGVRTTRASRIFAEEVPGDTILCVARLRDAGAIVVGKTNTPEFGYKATTDSDLFGPASTPFNTTMNAGGSSGGSAAAVAAGLVPLAQGSDAGGSLRVPAAFCGVYTLMPTFGRVAVPARPNAFRRLNPMVCYAPVARTVADAVIGLDLMSGPHTRDPYSFPVASPLRNGLARSLQGLRVAYSPTLGGYPVEAEVDDLVRSVVSVLAEAGARVEEVPFKLPVPHGELTRTWRRYLSVCHTESVEISRSQGIDITGQLRHLVAPDYLDSVETGARLSAVEFRLADVLRTAILDTFEDLFDRYDLVVSPVNCVTGIPNTTDRNTVGPSEVAGEPVDSLVGWSMTSPFNLIGSPAASVPAGFAANGVPVGLQIAGRRFNDETVVAACAAFEQLRPWHDTYTRLATSHVPAMTRPRTSVPSDPGTVDLTPTAALFDLDGTLVNTELRSQAAWTRLFAAHHVPCDAALLATFAGRRGHEVLAEHLHRFPAGSTVDELFDQAVSFLSDPQIPAAQPVPGAAAFVRALHGRGIPMGVVTSTLRRDAEELLDLLGVRELFTVLITAEDIRRGKPDPEGYLAGCAALDTAPTHVVGFEDAPSGIAAVRAAGMRCIAVATTHAATALGAADVVVNDLTQVAWPPAPVRAGR